MAPIPAALSELLPTEVRYTGIALGTNVAFAIFGGTAPLVATWLIKATGDLAAARRASRDAVRATVTRARAGGSDRLASMTRHSSGALFACTHCDAHGTR